MPFSQMCITPSGMVSRAPGLLSSQWSKIYLYQIDNESITLVR